MLNILCKQIVFSVFLISIAPSVFFRSPIADIVRSKKHYCTTISKPRIIFIYVTSINMFNKNKHGMQMRRNNQNDQEAKCTAMHIELIYFNDYRTSSQNIFFLTIFFRFLFYGFFSVSENQNELQQTICTAFFFWTFL